MRSKINILSDVFKEWLQIHQINYDYCIYTNEEWKNKDGGFNILQDAELIIAFENDLVYLLNYSGHEEIEEELQDLANGFGYYFEFGNHWNIGFYPLDDWKVLPSQDTPYKTLLTDYRWINKRKRIIKRSNNQCENCGIKPLYLEVHHCYYRYERYPWQYPDAALLALCKNCHQNRGEIELKWRGFMPSLTTNEINSLNHSLRRSLYWYDRRLLFKFLSSLHIHDADHHELLKQLLASRGHPEERERGKNKLL